MHREAIRSWEEANDIAQLPLEKLATPRRGKNQNNL